MPISIPSSAVMKKSAYKMQSLDLNAELVQSSVQMLAKQEEVSGGVSMCVLVNNCVRAMGERVENRKSAPSFLVFIHFPLFYTNILFDVPPNPPSDRSSKLFIVKTACS